MVVMRGLPAPELLRLSDAEAEQQAGALFRQVLGRKADAGGLAYYAGALENGASLDALRAGMAQSDEARGVVSRLYRQELGRDADADGLAAKLGGLAGGESLDGIRSGIGHSDEAARDIGVFYQSLLGRAAEPAGVRFWQDQLASGRAVSDVRADIGRSAEAVAQVQAVYVPNLGRRAEASEVEGFQAAKAAPAPAGAAFTVGLANGALKAVDARTLVAELSADITLNGGLTPAVTTPDGQTTRFRNGMELAAYALSMAVRLGQATPAVFKTYGLAVDWLKQIGQADIQAAANLQALAQADGAAGHAEDAYLHSVGAQLAMQIQAMPPGERHALTRRVDVGGGWAADVTVTGDAADRSGLAGFGVAKVDLDPRRTQLVADAQAQVADAAQARAAGNQLLAVLDEAQARVDVALAGLPAEHRADRMLGVAQQFVDAARGAAAAGNWNLVQTLETAADVSVKIAAQPEGQRTKLTERFMHKGTKHDITVDPNTADPFRTFKDHSKGKEDVGAIVEQVVGVVVNVVGVVFPVTAPLAVAWDVAHAAKSFAEGNILGGVLQLGAAAGAGLSGLGALGSAEGAAAAAGSTTVTGGLATQVASSLGLTAAGATSLGEQVLAGTALVGGLSGVAQGVASGNPLGIAAGVLQSVAAVAGGLVATDSLSLSGAARDFALTVAKGAGIAAVGAGSADAFARGDLQGGLLASLGLLLSQTAHALDLDKPPVPGVAMPPGDGAQPAQPTGTAPLAPVKQDDLPPVDGYGLDGKPLPVPPVPPEGGAGRLGTSAGGTVPLAAPPYVRAGQGPDPVPLAAPPDAGGTTVRLGRLDLAAAGPIPIMPAPAAGPAGVEPPRPQPVPQDDVGPAGAPALPALGAAALGTAAAIPMGSGAAGGLLDSVADGAARLGSRALAVLPEAGAAATAAAAGGGFLLGMTPFPAMPPPQTTDTAIPGVSVTHAQDQRTYTLGWTDPSSGRRASQQLFPDADNTLRTLGGRVLGQLQNGAPLLDPQAVASLVAGGTASAAPSQASLPATSAPGGSLAGAPVRLGGIAPMTALDPALAGPLAGSPPLAPPPAVAVAVAGQLPGFDIDPNAGKPLVLVTPPADPSLVPNSTAAPQPAVNLGDTQEGFTASGPAGPTILEARSNGLPTPAQQSEDHIGSGLGDGYTAQQSYLSRKPVPYGTAGSVRPDFASADGSVTYEVKNYNLATNSSGLVASIASQSIARAANLPVGATQNVSIDITGQTVTVEKQDAIRTNIEQKSLGNIPKAQIKFFERP